jgi:O-methyltransferase
MFRRFGYMLRDFLKLTFDGIVLRKDLARYELFERVGRHLYPKIRLADYGRSYLVDESFAAKLNRFPAVDSRRMYDRRYLLDQVVASIANLPGDAAECGCYQGASAYLICEQLKEKHKKLHLFDSFAGLSSPQMVDGEYWKPGALACSLTDVQRNLASYSFVQYHPGWIPERFSEVNQNQFCFVHLDVDLYQPTLDSLQFFYPRLVSGGALLLDDYGFLTCPGARKACDDYFADKRERIIHLPTGQGLVMKRDQ